MKSAKINMRSPTYRYNSATCRYERVRISWLGLISYATALAIASLAVLVILLLLHDYLVDTERESALRHENNSLEKSQILLTEKLSFVESNLSLLKTKDKALHEKLFASADENSDQESSGYDAKQQILLADASSFQEAANKISENSDRAIRNAIVANENFAAKLSLSQKDLRSISSMPLSNPIEHIEPDQILSGYGMRINPYHKGLYNHPGIDITVPRGTPVKATAAGKVVTAKYSSLEAGFGNYVDIDHGNGFTSRYAHLEEIHVRTGEQVSKGFIIGSSGNSGGSVAPHLHYEILRDGKNVNPIIFMIEGLSSIEHEKLRQASEKQNQSLD